uniref:27K transmission helper protein n=1 Tax=Tobacco rattle virus TaxID=12295 RepID=Q9IW55_9VIRU|nr:27K transmission helper protein [Tobacco rattle virus]
MVNGTWADKWPVENLFIDDFGKLVWFDILDDVVRITHFVSQVPTDLSNIPKAFISFIDNRVPMCINSKGWMFIRVKVDGEDVYYQKLGELDVSSFGDSILPPDFEFKFTKVTVPVDKQLVSKVNSLERLNAQLTTDLSQARTLKNFEELREGLVLNYSKAGGRLFRMVVRMIGGNWKLVSEINNDSDRWATTSANLVLKPDAQYLGYKVVKRFNVIGLEFDLARLNAIDVPTLLASVV